jgi:hypothetical protein
MVLGYKHLFLVGLRAGVKTQAQAVHVDALGGTFWDKALC